jgi:hypothetical protein
LLCCRPKDAAALGRQNNRSADVRVSGSVYRFFSESTSKGKLKHPANARDFNGFVGTFVRFSHLFWVAGSLLSTGSLGRLAAQD